MGDLTPASRCWPQLGAGGQLLLPQLPSVGMRQPARLGHQHAAGHDHQQRGVGQSQWFGRLDGHQRLVASGLAKHVVLGTSGGLAWRWQLHADLARRRARRLWERAIQRVIRWRLSGTDVHHSVGAEVEFIQHHLQCFGQRLAEVSGHWKLRVRSLICSPSNLTARILSVVRVSQSVGADVRGARGAFGRGTGLNIKALTAVTALPPPDPPSGPMSRIESADLMHRGCVRLRLWSRLA